MVFGLVIIQVIGFYLLYANSGKTTHDLYAWESKIRNRQKITRRSGTLLLASGFIGFAYCFGLAGGIAYGLVSWMLLASFTILFRPLLTKERSKTAVYAGQ